eukprot:2923738-Prorocentrum_lima.AAC.1
MVEAPPKTATEATWIWMDDASAQSSCRADTNPGGNPSAGGASAIPGPIDDDAWMSLPPHQE